MNFENPSFSNKNMEKRKKEFQRRKDKDREYGAASPVFPEGELDAVIEGIEGTPIIKKERAQEESFFNIPEEFKKGQKIDVGGEVWEIISVDEERGIVEYKKPGDKKSILSTPDQLRKKIGEYYKKIHKERKKEEGGLREAKIERRKETFRKETPKEEKIEKESKKAKVEESKEIYKEEEQKEKKLIEDSESLNLTREFLKERKLELTEETVEKWKEFLSEEHYNLLVKFAKEFCRGKGLFPPKGRVVDNSYYLEVLKEKGGIEALGQKQKEALRRIETLRKLVELRGTQMSISERMLLVRAAQDKIDILKGEIRGKKDDLPEVVENKAKISKIRDLQADIFSETYKGEGDKEDFKTKLYEEAFEILRKRYEQEGNLDLYEALRNEREIKQGRIFKGKFIIKGEKGKIKLSSEELKEAQEEFDRKLEEIYDKLLEKKIKETIGSLENAEGGIEKWYETIKDGLVKDFLRKQKEGKLKFGEKNIPESIEEVPKMAEEITSSLSDKPSKEQVEKVWRKEGGKLRKFWEKAKKGPLGALGVLCMLVIGALIGLVAIEFGVAGLMFKKIEGKK